jgi:EPS-associated MarR family transcriptional regulator
VRILQEPLDLTQRELAETLGMSAGGLNNCLNALIDKGIVKMQNFSSTKKMFKCVYLLTSMGMAEKLATLDLLLNRKMVDYVAFKLEISKLKSEASDD